MATENYRDAHGVKVFVVGKVTSGKHKGDLKLKTQQRIGSRPKGSTDYRKPSNVHGRGKK